MVLHAARRRANRLPGNDARRGPDLAGARHRVGADAHQLVAQQARVPTMNRDAAIDLLDRLHAAHNEFYAGGPDAPLRRLLVPNITWTVPGDNRIAGTYHGLEEVSDDDEISPVTRFG
jgi:hypothetical protein